MSKGAAWLWKRITDVLPGGAGEGACYPKERLVCILSFSIRLVCIVAPALFAWEHVESTWLLRACAAYVAGLAGAFVYADMGPEEWLRKLMLGYSWNPNVFPLGTLEGFCGSISKETMTGWQWHKMLPLRPWDGQPGSGHFGDE